MEKLSPEQHLANLCRHIELVKDACVRVGQKLMEQGKVEEGRALVARGFIHDNSKFFGIEWDYLHAGRGVPKDALSLAVRHHQLSNDHHPEHWGGVHLMPVISIREMVCDWYGRSQEFGTGLRAWVEDHAISRYAIDKNGPQWAIIQETLDLLIETPFGAVPR